MPFTSLEFKKKKKTTNKKLFTKPLQRGRRHERKVSVLSIKSYVLRKDWEKGSSKRRRNSCLLNGFLMYSTATSHRCRFCRSLRQICLTSTLDARLRSTGLSSPPAHCGARVWLCEAKFCCSTTKDLRSFGLKRKDVSFKKKKSLPLWLSHCLNYQWHERKKSFMSPLECVQDFQLHLPALKGWWSPAIQF